MQLILHTVDDTLALGRLLALGIQEAVIENDSLPAALYLYGDLGCGKTTLTRAMVEALPGGDKAEAASPSFTLCHEYPTLPRLLHADLYRLPDVCDLPEEVQDAMEYAGHFPPLLVLEWPERLAPRYHDADRLDIHLGLCQDTPIKSPKSLLRENTTENPAESLENLDILKQPCERKRLVNVTATGTTAERLLRRIRLRLESRFVSPPA